MYIPFRRFEIPASFILNRKDFSLFFPFYKISSYRKTIRIILYFSFHIRRKLIIYKLNFYDSWCVFFSQPHGHFCNRFFFIVSHFYILLAFCFSFQTVLLKDTNEKQEGIFIRKRRSRKTSSLF